MKTANRRAVRCCLLFSTLALVVCGCGNPPGQDVSPEGQGPAVKTFVYDVRLLENFLRMHLKHEADRQDWMGDLDLSRYEPNAAGEALIRILQRELGKGTGSEKPLVAAGLMNGQLIVTQRDEIHSRLLGLLERARKTICTMVTVESRYAVAVPKMADDLRIQWRQSTDGDREESGERWSRPRGQGAEAVADDITRQPLRMTWAFLNDAQVERLLEQCQGNPATLAHSNPRITLHSGQSGWAGIAPTPWVALRASLAEGNCILLGAKMATDEARKVTSPGAYVSTLRPADGNQPASRPAARTYEARIGLTVPQGMTVALRLPDPVWTRWQTAENGLEFIVLIKPRTIVRDESEILSLLSSKLEVEEFWSRVRKESAATAPNAP